MNFNEVANNYVKEAQILGWFKVFCTKNQTLASKQRLRNIYACTPNQLLTTKNIFVSLGFINISESDNRRLHDLVQAYLSKSTYRKVIPDSIKKELLRKQNNKCAICSQNVTIHSPVDHIVPFKYVGDELHNNYQILCTECNSRKNASIDFQIRYFFKTL